MSEPFNSYLRECKQQLGTGLAREHAYRPALKNLLSALHPTAVIINDPARIACGAPDFILLRDNVPFGYIEAKDMGNDLAETAASDQLRRYRDSLSNLILTNYLDFQWYVGGELRAEASLGRKRGNELTADKAGSAAVASLLAQFFSQEGEPLGTAEELAKRMAHLARLMKEAITQTVAQEGQNGPFHAQHQAFQATLIPGLQADEFADMYAQTLTYGLFAARVRAADTGGMLTRESIPAYLPSANPFLRRFFYQISGPDMPVTVSWLVDDLAQTLRRADMHAILRQFGQRTRREDPIIHFYETFLREYDPILRQSRGVYYTPEPVVSYIVRSLDAILQSHFGRPLGLADQQTLILDPATGTGTFLYFVIQHIYDKLHSMGQAGSWNGYVRENLLPRLFGFELLMAPYAVAHLKLGVLLRELGYQFESNERLNIFLTNALSEPILNQKSFGFAQFLSQEGNLAIDVKTNQRIEVILGNPPYSGVSANNNIWINDLMEGYKETIREEERQIQGASNDYAKFIRFAEWKLQQVDRGVLAFITDNGYLDNILSRDMRNALLKTFSKIYILNLHGEATRGSTNNPQGDENVFNITQGVVISIFVKLPKDNALADVFYQDVWGNRQMKYQFLLDNDLSDNTNWQLLNPQAPNWYLIPTDKPNPHYESWPKFNLIIGTGNPKKDRDKRYGTGVKTRHDSFVVAWSANEAVEKVKRLANRIESDSELIEELKLCTTNHFNIKKARERAEKDDLMEYVRPIAYRPFDTRYIVYQREFICEPKDQLMSHILDKENLCLAVLRKDRKEIGAGYFVARNLVAKDMVSNVDDALIWPLYIYPSDISKKGLFNQERILNLAPSFISSFSSSIKMEFVYEPHGDLINTFGARDIFAYIYSVFHSPSYRSTFSFFLNRDFPHIPIINDTNLFSQMVRIGHDLIALHLMESPQLNNLITRFPQGGNNSVEKEHPRYVEPTASQAGRVYINKTQFFEGVDKSVWEMQIGGYQPLQKWLKDRVGRTLSFDELMHYQRIALALAQTQQHMQTIDGLLPTWPLA